MSSFLLDLRHAGRALRRSPVVVAIAVLSIGLGVGANAAVFSWMDNLVLHPYPAIADPDRLVGLEVAAPDGDGWPLSYPTYREWRDGSRSFAGMAGWTVIRVSAREEHEGGALPLVATSVSGGYFGVLGVRAAIGRTLTPADEGGAAPVAVLSHAYWTRRYAGDRGVLGRTLFLNGQPVSIVGVAGPRFVGTYVGVVPDLFVPIALQPRLTGVAPATALEDRGSRWVQAVARLAPGVPRERAQAELDALARRLSAAAGDRPVLGALVVDARRQFLGGIVFPLLAVMLAVTAFLLLVACANVASLLLVRADGRRHEVAVRVALGASRTRIVRLAAAESLLLAAAGGTLGVLIALLSRSALYALIPVGAFPVTLPIELNARVLLFALGAAVVVAVACTVGPALAVSRTPPSGSLKSASRAVAPAASRVRSTLVAGQLAFSLLCLVTAGLFVRGLRAASAVALGFSDPDRVLLVGTDFAAARVTDSNGVEAVGELLRRLRALPGARAATVATMVPLGFGGRRTADVRVEGYAPQPDENVSAERGIVGSDYARTMGIPLVAGRDIADGDRPASLQVALVNEAFAHRFWPHASALGQRVDVGHGWATVVGVVRDGKYGSLTEAPRPVAYFPVTQWFQPGLTVHVRAAGSPRALIEPVRGELRRVNVDLAALQPRTLAEHIAASTFVQRTGAAVLGALGTAALLLSVFGVYGALAAAVAARRRELGIRLALGASVGSIGRMTVGYAAGVAAWGVGAGGVLAFAAASLLRNQIAFVSPADPVSLGGAAALLAVGVAAAAAIPTWRAVRVHPAVVLRDD